MNDDQPAILSDSTREALRSAGPWLRVVWLYGWFAVVLISVGAVVALVTLDQPRSAAGVVAVYLLYALCAIALVMPLGRSLRALRDLDGPGSQPALESFLVEQSCFWRRAGILTAVSLVIAVVAAVLIVVGGLFAAR